MDKFPSEDIDQNLETLSQSLTLSNTRSLHRSVLMSLILNLHLSNNILTCLLQPTLDLLNRRLINVVAGDKAQLSSHGAVGIEQFNVLCGPQPEDTLILFPVFVGIL